MHGFETEISAFFTASDTATPAAGTRMPRWLDKASDKAPEGPLQKPNHCWLLMCVLHCHSRHYSSHLDNTTRLSQCPSREMLKHAVSSTGHQQ